MGPAITLWEARCSWLRRRCVMGAISSGMASSASRNRSSSALISAYTGEDEHSMVVGKGDIRESGMGEENMHCRLGETGSMS